MERLPSRGACVNLSWFDDNLPRFGGEFKREEPLMRHTYYRIGGPAQFLAIPRSKEDLQWLAEGIRATGIEPFFMGSGSNLLVSDRGFRGLVIKTTRINLEIQSLGSDSDAKLRIRTGASVAVSTLLRRAAQEGWSGLELLTGVPGSMGGVVTMNAGTHLGETKDRIKRVRALSVFGEEPGSELIFEGDSLQFAYRKNYFIPKGFIVWDTEWEVELREPSLVKAQLDEMLARRKSTQPVDYPSCGSVFKNPKTFGKNAWQVVDQLGLRGHRIGDAQISEKHSNFIVNLGKARAQDVRALIDLIKKRAASELGIPLEEEVIYLGEF